ncbi:MAG: hypothetical protein AMXMBFR79_12390 [Chitinophagaceae bacterium]
MYLIKPHGWPYTNAVDTEIYKGKTDWSKISIVTPNFNGGWYVDKLFCRFCRKIIPT